MKRLVILAVILGSLLAPMAAHADGCSYVLGFATMAAAVPQIGQCQDNQSNSANGDAVQHTAGGLLVWRKADNWTAFTDGYYTWINGPNGLQERLNTDRFPWEAPAAATPSRTPTAGPPGQGSIAAEIAAVAVPDGYPTMAELSSESQLGCMHMAEDLQTWDRTQQAVRMHIDDQLCPYADNPGWPGFVQGSS